jgi:hypothetical protein
MFMSGPILRRYGFPNFDKIFGERPIQHGGEEPESSDARTGEARTAESKPQPASPAKPGGTGEAKGS